MKHTFRRVLALVSALVLGVGMAALPLSPAPALETEAAFPKQTTFACIGASTVAGAFANTSWPAELQKLLGGLCEVKNFGVNSRTVNKHTTDNRTSKDDMDYRLTDAYRQSIAYKADYTLIMLGCNDTKEYNWQGADTFKANYAELVRAYQAVGSEVIVVIEPWVKSDNGDIKEALASTGVRPTYKQVAEEMGLKTIDFFTPSEGKGNLYVDEVHPNDAGYRMLAETAFKALKDYGIVPEGSEDTPIPFRPDSSVGEFYGEFDGYDVMQWKNGATGNFNFASGRLADEMGIKRNTTVQNLTIDLSYYWDRVGGGNNDWWHFNTTDKTNQSAPSADGGNPHDNGFGTFVQYGMTGGKWNVLTVSRDEQKLGGSGSDWYVNVGALEAANSLYIRGYKITATLKDGTVKTLNWGTMKSRRAADDGEKLKIACVGASTTAGKNVAEDKGTSYPSFLQMILGRGAEVKNFGYPGASVTKGRIWSYIDGTHTENYQRMYKDSLDYKADVVIIDIGGNDAQDDVWARGTFEKDYEELINAYRNQGNDPLIMITAGTYMRPLNANLINMDKMLVDKVIPAMVRVANKYDLPIFDLRALMESDAEHYVCNEDGVHYTALGHKVEAQEIAKMLLPLVEMPENSGIPGEMIDPVNVNIPIGEYDGYRSLMWEKGANGGFAYDSGSLAFALDIEPDTVVDELSIKVSYYWKGSTVGNNWWHFNTTDKDGLSAPAKADPIGSPHDNGFGQFTAYGMSTGGWKEMTETRKDQLLGGNDWSVNVGGLEASNSLYIRGYQITAKLKDGTVKEANWGTYAVKLDTVALKAALDKAICDTGLLNFTLPTAEAYTVARRAAKAVLNNENATQAEVDAAVAALKAATDALEKLPADPEPPFVPSVPQTNKIKVACIGASTTFGFGASTTYPTQMGKALGARFEVKNFGENGATVQNDVGEGPAYMSLQKYTNSKNYQPDVVLIMMGANDSKPQNWKNGKNKFEEDYRELIRSYVELDSKPLVIVVTDIWVQKTQWGINDKTVVESIAPIEMAIAEEFGLPVLDMHMLTVGEDKYYNDDGVHMNNAGYTFVGQQAARAVAAWTANRYPAAEKKALQEAVDALDPNVDLTGLDKELADAYTAAVEAANAALADARATQTDVDAAVAALKAAADALVPAILWGDADKSGDVTTNDARVILQYCAELKSADDLDMVAANVSGDDEEVTTADARLILQYCAELIDTFPAEGK